MDLLGNKKTIGTGEKSIRIEKLIALFEKYLVSYKEKLKLNGIYSKIEDIFHNDVDIMT